MYVAWNEILRFELLVSALEWDSNYLLYKNEMGFLYNGYLLYYYVLLE